MIDLLWHLVKQCKISCMTTGKCLDMAGSAQCRPPKSPLGNQPSPTLELESNKIELTWKKGARFYLLALTRPYISEKTACKICFFLYYCPYPNDGYTGTSCLAGECMPNISAAFNVMDHEILVKKLQLYGFSEYVSHWFSNYITDRKQCVYINGDLSKLLDVEYGVSLWPLLYTIYINELLEVVLKNSGEFDTAKSERKYLCCYADDSTLTCIGSDHTNISQDLSENCKAIAAF